jgi:hypothetical protein
LEWWKGFVDGNFECEFYTLIIPKLLDLSQGADHLTFEGGGGGGGLEDSDCARIFFRPGEQDRYFFPVKVQRKIFFSQYISRQDIFFASHNNGLQ